VVTALLAAPRASLAAACCGSGHGLGQRLGPSERAAISISLRGADRFGGHGYDGAFALAPPGVLDLEGRAELGVLVAPVSRLQLGLVAPLVLSARRSGDVSATGGGLGDLAFSARFDVVPLSSAGALPAIAITTALTVPTGRSAADTTDPLAAGATGLGAFEVRPGIFIEKNFDGAATAIFSASVGLRTAMTDARGERVELGPRARFVAAAGPIFDSGLSLSGGVVHEIEAAPSIAGATTPGADRRRTAALVFAGYDISSRYTLLASLEADLPIPVIGKNEPSAVALAIGLRRAFLRHE